MLAISIKAADLVRLQKLHRSAFSWGMHYQKPYRAHGQIAGAEGTIFSVIGNTLVACTMATRHRMILHARIPCAAVHQNDGALCAIETTKDFDRALRRFGDKLLILKTERERLEITLPRPGNARGDYSG